MSNANTLPGAVSIVTLPRPLTGAMSEGDLAIRSLCRPVFCEEHVIQAWYALAVAERGEKVDANLAFAMTRLEHAKVARVAKGNGRRCAVEIASLAVALRSFGLQVA